ncbi:MAG: 30S ribosomal protein S10 [Mycoplasmataceae bacterium RC_NB112A]|nr:MAG: 30S ribosomal protein S10 [Mycoplasmataceae bacterium RC_NB112A]
MSDTENKKKQFKIVISGYDLMTLESAAKLVTEKLTQIKFKFKGPIPFPNRRLVVAVPTSPHKHKDAQEKYERITHKRNFFVLNPPRISPAVLDSLLKLEVPGGVGLSFVNLPGVSS